jgi:signal transduction histidine kinase
MARAGGRRWFRLPGRTLRTRLTVLYSALLLMAGILLLAITNVGVRTDTVAVPKGAFDVVPNPPYPGFVDGPHSAFDRLAVSSLVALVVTVLLSVWLAWWVAGRALRPLRTMTATAQRISVTNLHERLALEGPDDEVKELSETLDDLFARLDASFESQRHFVANASHELRTPLTAERALLQVALADPDASAESLRSTCEEVLVLGAQQERLIDALLTLASGERGVERWESFDICEIAERVVAGREADVAARGLRLDTSLASAQAVGEPALVESLIANLVDNAVQNNLDGGRVEVCTTTVAGRPTLAVRNTGPVVPDDQVDRLLQPFERLDGERIRHRGRYGLGLAIVRAVTDAHGGTLTVRARPEGGLDVEVVLRADP